MAIHQHRPTEGRSNWKNLFYLIKSLAQKKSQQKQNYFTTPNKFLSSVFSAYTVYPENGLHVVVGHRKEFKKIIQTTKRK